jgi:putative ABC transport system permease protein
VKLTDIALSNLKRRKAKLAFSVFGLLIGIATIVSLYSITAAMKADIAQKIDEFGANIVVVPKSGDLSLSYGGLTVGGVAFDVKDLPEDSIQKIRSIKNRDSVSTVAPKLLGAVKVEGATQQLLLVGVDFPSELRMKKWWEIKGMRPAGPDDVLLGHTLALTLKKQAGDTLVANGKTFKVAGVLAEIGGQEDNLILADLHTTQILLKEPGKISLLEVSALCTTCPIDEITKQINGALPTAKATALKQAVKAREDTVNRLQRFSLAVGVVVMLIGMLVVFTTMMSSVNERTREIGIFRAIGFRKRHVIQVILTESFVISLVGGLLGYFVGMLSARLVAPVVAQVDVAIKWNPILGLVAIGAAVVVGLVASAYPAYRAAQLDPAEALRFI